MLYDNILPFWIGFSADYGGRTHHKMEECGNGELQAKLHTPAAGKSTCAAVAQNALSS